MTQRALLLLLGSIALCSSCAKPAPMIMTVPVVECPAPVRPTLPDVDPALPLDHAANVEVLMIRDDAYRAYAQGLEAAVQCYRSQVEASHDH
jgi:hypothetical protein